MRRDELGELVGRGRTSDVFAFDADSVVKIRHVGIPDDWPAFEAALTAAVQACGVPAPKVRDLVEIEGRTAVVFERVDGPSMWQQMCDAPDRAPALAVELAAIQKSLFAAGIPAGVPDLVDRTCRKILAADGLAAQERQEAVALAEARARGAGLLHGDLHPGNILMGRKGPVVIDWFDATIGHPIADVVRSSILIRPSAVAAATHLPGARAELLRQIHNAYVAEFSDDLVHANDVGCWQRVVAAARLSEGAEVDERVLLDLWRNRVEAEGAAALTG